MTSAYLQAGEVLEGLAQICAVVLPVGTVLANSGNSRKAAGQQVQQLFLDVQQILTQTPGRSVLPGSSVCV